MYSSSLFGKCFIKRGSNILYVCKKYLLVVRTSSMIFMLYVFSGPTHVFMGFTACVNKLRKGVVHLHRQAIWTMNDVTIELTQTEIVVPRWSIIIVQIFYLTRSYCVFLPMKWFAFRIFKSLESGITNWLSISNFLRMSKTFHIQRRIPIHNWPFFHIWADGGILWVHMCGKKLTKMREFL